jgi:hypothetical protein
VWSELRTTSDGVANHLVKIGRAVAHQVVVLSPHELPMERYGWLGNVLDIELGIYLGQCIVKTASR